MPEHLNADEERRIGNLEVAVKDMAQRMQVVEAGVSNFRMFQGTMMTHKDEVHDFIVRHEERERAKDEAEEVHQVEQEKKDARRSKIHFSLLGGLITLLVGITIALVTWILSGHHFVVSGNVEPTTMDAGMPQGMTARR